MSIKYPDKKTYKKSVKTILDSVYGEEKKKFSYKPVIAGLTAAVLCALIIFNFGTIKVLAEKLGEKLGFVSEDNEKIVYESENSTLKDYINYDVYKDEDEHVRFEILELLSDGMTAVATIRYTGLDEKGVEWIKNHSQVSESKGSTSETIMSDNLVQLSPAKVELYDEEGNMYGYKRLNFVKQNPSLIEVNENEIYCLAWMRSVVHDDNKVELVVDYKMSEKEGEDTKKSKNIVPDKEIPFVEYEIEGTNDDNLCIDSFCISGLSLFASGYQNKVDKNEVLSYENKGPFREVTVFYKDDSGLKLEIAGQGQHNVLDEKSGLTDMIFEFDGALSVNNRGVISKIKEFDAEGITKVVLEKNNGQKYIFKASPKTME